MNALNGEMAGFSSSSDNAAQLKLKGKVYDMANVEIKGRHHFKSNDSAIDLNFKHMPLPLITPYMAEFAGYKIDKGQMALDLHYTIDHQRLQAQNKILIDQLVLGDKIENPKAVNLPLELAVTLLKDSSGKINLDFPISGSLEDPKFSVAALVGDVLINLVSKVATAPFKALSGMFDSDIDLSTINFVAGSSDLTPEASDKLSKIAQALKEKPELLLEIKALAYHVQDWPMLSRDVVLEVLKKKKSTELRDQQGERIRAEYIELSDADYLRLLATFYAEVFPSEIEFSVLGKPRMKNNPDVDFYTIARLQLEAIMQPELHRLNDLAIARSNRIAQYLSDQLGIDKERLYLLGTEIEKGDAAGEVKAVLGLNVRH
jgi:outer membrane protein OmpA-like peptidoglycan-associated protein